MTKSANSLQTSGSGVTLRAVILGLILIPVNIYFIMANVLNYWSTIPTIISLIFNVVITLTILVAFNLLIRRYTPRFALRQGELLTIYIMLSVSSAVAGHDMIQSIIPTMPHAFWFATPENEWKELFWRYLPRWLVVDSLPSLKDYYKGDSTLYTTAHLHAWLRPVFWWTVFLTTLVWVMVCLNVLLRKQWIEREKLTYPIIQLPFEMTLPKGSFFRSKMMWIGFSIAGGIHLINGLHVLFPALPEIPVRQADLGRYFTEKPWNALGWVPLYILPFAVGLSFVMPSEMSFSLWFFYLFWKGQRVLGSALGLHSLPDFPYDGPQGIGACLALALFALIGGRQHLFSVLKSLSKSRPYEEKEPMKYRWAVLGLVGGLIFLVAFSYQGGMVLWTAILYFLIYYLLAISITRIRAEVGPPTHEMYMATPRHLLTDALGTRRLSHGSLGLMALYFPFNRGYRAHPMPHILEGFKLAEESRMNQRRLVPVMMLATVVGAICGFWAYLTVTYRIGFDSVGHPEMGARAYDALRGWLYNPTGTNVPATAFMCVGFLFTGFMWWMRRIFPLWPFHPAGYALASSTWTFGWLWFSVFVSWAIKTTLLKFGGVGLYRKAFPLFLGLIWGEFLVGGTWVLIRLFFGIQVYSFFR